MDYKYSKHAQDMLRERNIQEAWVIETLENPQEEKLGDDNNMHYFKAILENSNRVLHVVINHKTSPKMIVTVFFDRKARRQI